MRLVGGPDAEHTAVVHDPHPLWIDAVDSMLESIGVKVVGRAAKADQALALVDEHEPYLLIVELQREDGGGMDGFKLIEQARQRFAAPRVIVLAASEEQSDIDRAFEAGAIAYVLKTTHPADVAATIRQTFAHSVFIAKTHANGPAKPVIKEPAPADDASSELTRREREILALVSEGHSNRELAKMLWVTEQTVKFHLSNIYRKLDVSNRTEASMWAHKHALLSPVEATAA
jgi:NarL family two-component system response regulator LiaR